MSDSETEFHKIGDAIDNAVRSQMFGKKCYKINNKAFVCLFQDVMVFKLPPPHHQDAISLEGAKLFDPSGKGRPMKEWVQLGMEHQAHWGDFARTACAYVAQS